MENCSHELFLLPSQKKTLFSLFLVVNHLQWSTPVMPNMVENSDHYKSRDAQTEAKVCTLQPFKFFCSLLSFFLQLLSFYKLRWQRSPHQVAQCFAIFGPNSPLSHPDTFHGTLQQGCHLFGIGLDRADRQL